MAKILTWLAVALVVVLLLAGAALLVLHRRVGTDDFRQRLEQEASAALGVPVALGGLQVDVWPLPAVALTGVVVSSQPPVTLERLELRPSLLPLLQGQLFIETLVLRKAVLPQRGVDAVLLAVQKKKSWVALPTKSSPQAPSPPTDAVSSSWWPRRTVFDDVTWISHTGAATAFEGQALLGADALPDSVSLRLIRGHLQGLRGQLTRESPVSAQLTAEAGDQWSLRVDVGGGTIEGKLGMRRLGLPSGRAADASDNGDLVLQGKLQTRAVDVSALTAPAKPLSGLLDADTTLQARAATTAAWVDALKTQTSFKVREATLHGIDLVKAVNTVGLSRGGQTRLQTLTGQVNTTGRSLQLTQLVASSGALNATGSVQVSPSRALGGQVNVSLSGDSQLATAVGSAVSVPLVVGGTLDAPEVTLSRSALLGAALGTAVMPGVGTGAGAQLGEKLGRGLRDLWGK